MGMNMVIVAGVAGSLGYAAAFAPGSFALRPASLLPLRQSSTWSAFKMLQEGDSFPLDAAISCGVQGKNAVLYFYSADGAPRYGCNQATAVWHQILEHFPWTGVTQTIIRHKKYRM